MNPGQEKDFFCLNCKKPNDNFSKNYGVEGKKIQSENITLEDKQKLVKEVMSDKPEVWITEELEEKNHEKKQYIFLIKKPENNSPEYIKNQINAYYSFLDNADSSYAMIALFQFLFKYINYEEFEHNFSKLFEPKKNFVQKNPDLMKEFIQSLLKEENLKIKTEKKSDFYILLAKSDIDKSLNLCTDLALRIGESLPSPLEKNAHDKNKVTDNIKYIDNIILKKKFLKDIEKKNNIKEKFKNLFFYYYYNENFFFKNRINENNYKKDDNNEFQEILDNFLKLLDLTTDENALINENWLEEELYSLFYFEKCQNCKENKKCVHYDNYQHLFTLIPFSKIVFLLYKEKNRLPPSVINILDKYFEIKKNKNKNIIVYTDKKDEKYKTINSKEEMLKIINKNSLKDKNQKYIVDNKEFRIPFVYKNYYRFLTIEDELENKMFKYDPNNNTLSFDLSNIDISKEFNCNQKELKENPELFQNYLNFYFKDIMIKEVEYLNSNKLENINFSNIVIKEIQDNYLNNFLNFIKSNKILENKEDFAKIKNNIDKFKIKNYSNNKESQLPFFFIYDQICKDNNDLKQEYQKWEEDKLTEELKNLKEILQKGKFLQGEEILKTNETIRNYIIELTKKDINYDEKLIPILEFCIDIQLDIIEEKLTEKEKLLYLWFWVHSNMNIFINLEEIRSKLYRNEDNMQWKEEMKKEQFIEDKRLNQLIYIKGFSLVFQNIMNKCLNDKIFEKDEYLFQSIVRRGKYIEDKLSLYNKEFVILNLIKEIYGFYGQKISEKIIENFKENQSQVKEPVSQALSDIGWILKELKEKENGKQENENTKVKKDKCIIQFFIAKYKTIVDSKYREDILDQIIKINQWYSESGKFFSILFGSFYSFEEMKDSIFQSFSPFLPLEEEEEEEEDNTMKLFKNISDSINANNATLEQVIIMEFEKNIIKNIKYEFFKNKNLIKIVQSAIDYLKDFDDTAEQKPPLANLKKLYAIVFLKYIVKLMVEIILDGDSSFDFSEINNLLKPKGGIQLSLKIYILKTIRSLLNSYKDFKAFNFTGNQMLWASEHSFKENSPQVLDFLFLSSLNPEDKEYIQNYNSLKKIYDELKKFSFRTSSYDNDLNKFLNPEKIDVFLDVTFNTIISSTFSSEYRKGMEFNEFMGWINNLINKYEIKDKFLKDYLDFFINKFYQEITEKIESIVPYKNEIYKKKKIPQNFSLRNLEIMLIGFKFYSKFSKILPIKDIDKTINPTYIDIYYASLSKRSIIEQRNKKIYYIRKDSNNKPHWNIFPINKNVSKDEYKEVFVYDKNAKEIKEKFKSDSISIKEFREIENIGEQKELWVITKYYAPLNKQQYSINLHFITICKILQFLSFSNIYFNFKLYNTGSGMNEELLIEVFESMSSSLHLIGIENEKLFMILLYSKMGLIKEIETVDKAYSKVEDCVKDYFINYQKYISFMKDIMRYTDDEMRTLLSDIKLNYNNMAEIEKTYRYLRYFYFENYPSLSHFINQFNEIYHHEEKYPLIDNVINNKYDFFSEKDNLKDITEKIKKTANDVNKYDIDYVELENNNNYHYIYSGFYEYFDDIIIDNSWKKMLKINNRAVNYANGDQVFYNFDEIEEELNKLFFGVCLKA